MKKQWISAALVLLLMLLIPVVACADVIYPAPEDFVVGEEVDHLLATLDPGGTAWTDPAQLPPGLRLETVETEVGVNVYLRGVPTSPGVYDLFIRYNDTESLLTVTVKTGEAPAPAPVSVAVETLPNKTLYTAGDLLDPAGLSLRVQMSDGSSRLVTEGYSLYPIHLEQAGTRIIEVNYEGLLCYFEVEIEPGAEVIEGIGVLTLPNRIIYEVGDTLDPTGLSIRVYTNNGTRDVVEGLLCEPMVLDQPGQQLITVRYEDKTCSFTVQVQEEAAPAAIAVYRLPDKLDYQVGETLDTRGLVLVETGGDEPSFLEDGFECRPLLLDQAGSQEIVVSRGELQCSFHVNVREVPAAPSQGGSTPPTVLPSQSDMPGLRPGPELIPSRESAGQAQSGKLLVGVIVAAAFLALLVLVGYVLLMKRSSKEYADSLRAAFRKKK